LLKGAEAVIEEEEEVKEEVEVMVVDIINVINSAILAMNSLRTKKPTMLRLSRKKNSY